MARNTRKSLNQYLWESLEQNPELEAMYAETRIEGRLALDLARLRNERRMSQRALSAATQIPQPVISRVERGAEVPTVATLYKLMQALDATITIGPQGISVRAIDRPRWDDLIASNFTWPKGLNLGSANVDPSSFVAYHFSSDVASRIDQLARSFQAAAFRDRSADDLGSIEWGVSGDRPIYPYEPVYGLDDNFAQMSMEPGSQSKTLAKGTSADKAPQPQALAS